MICFDKITEIYSIVDEFCQNFEQQTSSFILGNKPKRPPKMSTSEVITIVLLFHLSGFRTFKHFYIFYVQKHMKSEFPHTVAIGGIQTGNHNDLHNVVLFAESVVYSPVWAVGNCIGFFIPIFRQ